MAEAKRRGNLTLIGAGRGPRAWQLSSPWKFLKLNRGETLGTGPVRYVTFTATVRSGFGSIDRCTRATSQSAAIIIDRSRGRFTACMPAVPSTNICHVIYEPGITLCPIYYILRYVDGLAILSNRPGQQSGHVALAPTRSAYDVLRTPSTPSIRRWETPPFQLFKPFKLFPPPFFLSLSLSLSIRVDRLFYFSFLIPSCAIGVYSTMFATSLSSIASLLESRFVLFFARLGTTFDRTRFEKSRTRDRGTC